MSFPSSILTGADKSRPDFYGSAVAISESKYLCAKAYIEPAATDPFRDDTPAFTSVFRACTLISRFRSGLPCTRCRLGDKSTNRSIAISGPRPRISIEDDAHPVPRQGTRRGRPAPANSYRDYRERARRTGSWVRSPQGTRSEICTTKRGVTPNSSIRLTYIGNRINPSVRPFLSPTRERARIN